MRMDFGVFGEVVMGDRGCRLRELMEIVWPVGYIRYDLFIAELCMELFLSKRVFDSCCASLCELLRRRGSRRRGGLTPLTLPRFCS